MRAQPVEDAPSFRTAAQLRDEERRIERWGAGVDGRRSGVGRRSRTQATS